MTAQNRTFSKGAMSGDLNFHCALSGLILSPGRPLLSTAERCRQIRRVLQIGIVFRRALSEMPQRCRAAPDAANTKIADPTQSSLYSIPDYCNRRDGVPAADF